MTELKGSTVSLDLYETAEDLIRSGKNGAVLVYDGTLKKRHKASLFRIIWYQRDEECWIPFSQFNIQEADTLGTNATLSQDPESKVRPARLQITKWLFDQRTQAPPMGVKR
jgi:hypothetical protein